METEQGKYDSAYVGKKLPKHVRNEICEKGYRNTPLTEDQKENNRRKSKIRCRIEHVFGFMTTSMNGLTVRSIGFRRATFNIGLTNFVYNLCRYSFCAERRLTYEKNLFMHSMDSFVFCIMHNAIRMFIRFRSFRRKIVE